jgi:hypothetical protein
MVVAITIIQTAQSGTLKQRLPATSAEIVGAAAGAAVLMLWSFVRLRLPALALRGSTEQAP